jgi:hypothetical protein
VERIELYEVRGTCRGESYHSGYYSRKHAEGVADAARRLSDATVECFPANKTGVRIWALVFNAGGTPAFHEHYASEEAALEECNLRRNGTSTFPTGPSEYWDAWERILQDTIE